MRSSAGHLFLRLLGSLCATIGLLAWFGVACSAISDLDALTPHNEVGGRLMAWGLTGTVLMILGTVILHVGQAAAEREEPASKRVDSSDQP